MIYLFSFQHAVVVKFHRNERLMRQYRACGFDSLDWELCASSITVLCVQAVMILSPSLFMPSLYSHSNLKNFVPSHFYTDLIASSDAAGAMLQAAKKRDYVVYTPVAKHAVSYMNAKCTYGSFAYKHCVY